MLFEEKYRSASLQEFLYISRLFKTFFFNSVDSRRATTIVVSLLLQVSVGCEGSKPGEKNQSCTLTRDSRVKEKKLPVSGIKDKPLVSTTETTPREESVDTPKPREL